MLIWQLTVLIIKNPLLQAEFNCKIDSTDLLGIVFKKLLLEITFGKKKKRLKDIFWSH